MGLFAPDETFRVEFPDGWVEMRAVMTYGDRKAALDASRIPAPPPSPLSGGNGASVGAPKFVMSETAYVVALLARMIESWSEDEPVTPENVERLSDDRVDKLMVELNTRDKEQRRTEVEAAPLDSNSLTTSEVAAPGPKS